MSLGQHSQVAVCLGSAVVNIVSKTERTNEGAVYPVLRTQWHVQVYIDVQYQKLYVTSENTIWRFLDSAGTNHPQLRSTNPFTLLVSKNRVVQIDS